MTQRTTSTTASLLPTAFLWVVAPLWYVACEAVTALTFPGYSYATFYISDLGVGEQATLDGRDLLSQVPQVMNAGFIGAGLLFLIGLVLLLPSLARGVRTPLTVAFGTVYAAGITLVGLVPGSPSNVQNGLIILHVIGAIAAIGGGNLLAILSAGPLGFLGRARLAGPVLGALGFLSALLLMLHIVFPDGISERGSVYSVMLWQLVVGIALFRGERRRTSAVTPNVAAG